MGGKGKEEKERERGKEEDEGEKERKNGRTRKRRRGRKSTTGRGTRATPAASPWEAQFPALLHKGCTTRTGRTPVLAMRQWVTGCLRDHYKVCGWVTGKRCVVDWAQPQGSCRAASQELQEFGVLKRHEGCPGGVPCRKKPPEAVAKAARMSPGSCVPCHWHPMPAPLEQGLE